VLLFQNLDIWLISMLYFPYRGDMMTNRAVLLQEIETLPANCIGEVVDFVEWIKHRKLSQIPETMLLSEAALSKDWDTPEEDEAWASL
jgi:hypothetical protein